VSAADKKPEIVLFAGPNGSGKSTITNQVEKIATENKTSFNNVVISMIESCLNEEKGPS